MHFIFNKLHEDKQSCKFVISRTMRLSAVEVTTAEVPVFVAVPDHYVDFRKRKSTELWECNEAAIQKSSPRGRPLVKLANLLLVFLREAALADVFYGASCLFMSFVFLKPDSACRTNPSKFLSSNLSSFSACRCAIS